MSHFCAALKSLAIVRQILHIRKTVSDLKLHECKEIYLKLRYIHTWCVSKQSRQYHELLSCNSEVLQLLEQTIPSLKLYNCKEIYLKLRYILGVSRNEVVNEARIS